VNDSLGHAAGDSVLRGVADLFKDAMRRRLDWVARFGGEEFVIVLPDTDIGRAVAIAERLRQAVEASRVVHGADEIRVTASFGVAECLDDDDAESLLARADAMLYRAKQTGRNRVVWGVSETV
jgi:diguanylate cyclase (GGDEF)-like protein